MQTELNHTVKSLFDKNSLDDMSRDDLLLMTVKYPYSAIFQFLYTRKLQSLHDLRFPSSVAKTALYFSNPHWLNHQLRAKTSVEALAEMEMAFEKSHAEEVEIVAPVLENLNEEIAEVIPSPENIEIPLEPFYAVDYFASQGIRLREEDQQDQLGKKLKSFTEWLKSMKKVHPEKSKGQMDEKTEASIKSDAEQSNDKADVLTETMAEVFIKQGLTQKAVEVYEKLSLLDPVKSATFAAKISELKAE